LISAHGTRVNATATATTSRPIYRPPSFPISSRQRPSTVAVRPSPDINTWRSIPDDDSQYLARQRAFERELAGRERSKGYGNWVLFGVFAAICYLSCEFDAACYVHL
jgi:hypothetical protein